MTGPPYPHPPIAPGSNQIGEFEIGVSPIGTLNAFDLWITVISQYANSPILTKLIRNFAQYIDQTQNFDNFFDMIWNVDTAQGIGLDIWGRIVGVSRTVTLAAQTFFDFEEASGTGFGQAPFFSGGGGLTTNFQLTDEAFRILILAKALTNICNGSIPAINQVLLSLFPGRGNCYVTDGENMTMTYTFQFGLTPVELAILQQTGVLPKPVGVVATIVQL